VGQFWQHIFHYLIRFSNSYGCLTYPMRCSRANAIRSLQSIKINFIDLMPSFHNSRTISRTICEIIFQNVLQCIKPLIFYEWRTGLKMPRRTCKIFSYFALLDIWLKIAWHILSSKLELLNWFDFFSVYVSVLAITVIGFLIRYPVLIMWSTLEILLIA